MVGSAAAVVVDDGGDPQEIKTQLHAVIALHNMGLPLSSRHVIRDQPSRASRHGNTRI